MQPLKQFAAFVLLFSITFNLAAQVKTVDHFDKVIVSPYIQVTFVEGNEESVTIDNIQVSPEKLHIEVNDNTLHIYLDGTKDIPKNEKTSYDGYKESHALYNNTSVVATVTYKTLHELSLRGEEEQLCKSAIKGDEFILNVYGESTITFNELNLQKLFATLYGEGVLNVKAGSVDEQRYICYGEGKINTLAITGSSSRITAYGEADFNLNVADQIKITAYGEARLYYKGNPDIKKGLHFGELTVEKID